ncbi:DNA-methyltransferase [Halobaculum rubrum]|uniref:DNA-methyltransferase n=1 Tax=Halobaculum rubrum TaxID=2872158 RepID=UPI001CA3D1A5|nr:site-specific DNA-methyltransferase [Halobaculum rubrum]QZX99813.1 site-specific DNA-methyltransferase [Halobaculum rubrum]QZX99850.1 site-specific DNA-methyltransferase [Halobaculum rubrum]
MAEKDDSRNIKPRSDIPASADEIIAGAPDQNLSTDIAANIVGMRSAHFRKIVREGLGGTIGKTTSFETLAKVYARSRPSPSVLTDKHFTTEEGQTGLIDLVEYLEDPADPPNQSRWSSDEFETNQIFLGSVFDHFSQIPLNSIQSVITSPPYWGMRVYSEEFEVQWSDGTEVPFGGEQTPEDYIRHTLELFLRLRPILTDSATIWWNVGDVYNTRTEIRETSMDRKKAVVNNEERSWANLDAKRDSYGHEYLKDKDLTLIPFRIAQGLQRCGFYARSVITWRKEKVVPETVSDRPTTGHENLLLISNSSTYQFNEKRWREEERKSFGGRSRHENKDLRTVWELDHIKGGLKEQEAAIIDELGNIMDVLSETNKKDTSEMLPAETEKQLQERLKQLLALLAEERDSIQQSILDPEEHEVVAKRDSPNHFSEGSELERSPSNQDLRRGPPVWSMPVADGKYKHAAPFPVQLPARCILLSIARSASGDSDQEVVYDPFMGSGTTAVAAENIKRLDSGFNFSWIGSEIVPKYKKLAEDRISQMRTDEDPDEWITIDQTTMKDFS